MESQTPRIPDNLAHWDALKNDIRKESESIKPKDKNSTLDIVAAQRRQQYFAEANIPGSSSEKIQELGYPPLTDEFVQRMRKLIGKDPSVDKRQAA
jgi:hypothetical protein